MQRTELMPIQSNSAIAVLPEQFANAGLSAGQVAAIGRAWWKRTALIAAGTVLLVALVSLLMPKTYTATATLMVDHEINDPLAGREFPISLMGSYMATQVELLGGREVLLEVVDRLNLTEHEDYNSGFSGELPALREWIAQNLAKKLDIRQGKFGSQLIYVTHSANDPKIAADVANAIVDVYSQHVHKRRTGPASEHAKRYARELEELKLKVDRARDLVTKYRQRHQLVTVETESDIDVAMLDSLEQRLLEAQTARRVAEAKLAANPTLSAAVMDSSLVQSMRTRLSELEAQLAELRSTMGARHPQVVEVQSQINATRRSLQAEERRYEQSASGELISARELEKKLSAAVETQRTRLLGVRKLQDEGSKYVLELASAEAAYKRALDGYDQVMIASSGQYTNISSVSRATEPPKPSSPKLIVNLIFGLLAGCALGVILPFAHEMLRRRVRCRDDLERDHGIPVLAEFGPIPALNAAA